MHFGARPERFPQKSRDFREPWLLQAAFIRQESPAPGEKKLSEHPVCDSEFLNRVPHAWRESGTKCKRDWKEVTSAISQLPSANYREHGKSSWAELGSCSPASCSIVSTGSNSMQLWLQWDIAGWKMFLPRQPRSGNGLQWRQQENCLIPDSPGMGNESLSSAACGTKKIHRLKFRGWFGKIIFLPSQGGFIWKLLQSNSVD